MLPICIWILKNVFDTIPNEIRDAALVDPQLLRNALNQAKKNLQDAAGLVSTGFDPDDEHALSTAADVEMLATDVYDAMQTKRKKHRRAQREASGDA